MVQKSGVTFVTTQIQRKIRASIFGFLEECLYARLPLGLPLLPLAQTLRLRTPTALRSAACRRERSAFAALCTDSAELNS